MAQLSTVGFFPTCFRLEIIRRSIPEFGHLISSCPLPRLGDVGVDLALPRFAATSPLGEGSYFIPLTPPKRRLAR